MVLRRKCGLSRNKSPIDLQVIASQFGIVMPAVNLLRDQTAQ